jgi:hypothetical protein
MRLAFLIDENEHWAAMLDAIFAECYTRWGGRFSLLIPCERGEIRPAYIPWLKAYDPDIIYSYVDLTKEQIAEIHERFCPAFLTRHDFVREENRDARTFRPRLPVEPLSALSIVAQAAKSSPMFAAQPARLLDVQYGVEPSRFLQENFGCYQQSGLGWPPPRDLDDLVSTLTFVPLEIHENPTIQPRARGDVVTSENELLEHIASERNLIGFAQLSAAMCPRLEFMSGEWAGTLNFVVGDSYADRIIFWNGRSHLQAWLDSGIVTFKVSKDAFDDADFVASLQQIIRTRVHVALNSSSNTHIQMRSASVSEADLTVLRDRITKLDKWNLYLPPKVAHVDSCVPTSDALCHAHFKMESGAFLLSTDWHESPSVDGSFRPTSIPPRHMRDLRPPQSASRGGWSIDMDIQRTADHSRAQNDRHHWRLPLRLRMAGAFALPYHPQTHAPACRPRTTQGGLLSFFAFADGVAPEINAPTDEEAFTYALCALPDWNSFRGGQHQRPYAKFVHIRPSDKGRYLKALLSKAEGIHAAKEIFLKQFWRDQFDLLGGAIASTDTRISAVGNKLKKRIPTGKIESQEDWDRLANVVIGEARNERLPNRTLKFDRLAEDFDGFRNAFWSKHQPGTPRDEWDEDERRSLARSVQYLCERKILYQGYAWRCPHCYNTNWIGIDGLRQFLSCEVCEARIPAPVVGPWFFLEPHELFHTPASADQLKPDAEIDLLAVTDGRVKLCEIKASRRDIDIPKMAEIAKRVRPDVAVLAVMEPQSKALTKKLAELQTALAGTGIHAELMTLESNDIDDSPFLPAANRVTIRLL